MPKDDHPNRSASHPDAPFTRIWTSEGILTVETRDGRVISIDRATEPQMATALARTMNAIVERGRRHSTHPARRAFSEAGCVEAKLDAIVAALQTIATALTDKKGSASACERDHLDDKGLGELTEALAAKLEDAGLSFDDLNALLDREKADN